ncbi:hypothetical protein [Streptomyces sp. C10-9-1]|uniref:hypothetical protein n=1 Tax=Streptomyces sp. C10-9-1 TaxID=1859285 RepID=UPI003D72DC55
MRAGDRDLLDLTVRTKGGKTATLHTTSNHPFWNDTTHTWVAAGELHRGDILNTATNGHAYVVTTRITPGAANRWISPSSNSTRTMRWRARLRYSLTTELRRDD